jgi:cupin 2 domain-containing protein
MEVRSLITEIPPSLPQELTETLVGTKHTRIERIVSHGHASPDGYWYDQDENEFVLLFSGAARLQFEDEVIEMKPGEWINIPAHRKHRVGWTTPDEPTIWLAVFYTDLH